MQEKLFICIWVGSLTNSENPFKYVSEYNFVSSEVLVSPDHQDEGLALKSPVITGTVGLHLFMSFKSCSRFDKIWNYFGLGSDKLQILLSFYYCQ